VHLLWPIFDNSGPSVEHAYLGLSLLAVLLAAPSVRSRPKSGALRSVAIVSTGLALVPLAVASARFLLAFYELSQLRPP
jgi:hypothetical protein